MGTWQGSHTLYYRDYLRSVERELEPAPVAPWRSVGLPLSTALPAWIPSELVDVPASWEPVWETAPSVLPEVRMRPGYQLPQAAADVWNVPNFPRPNLWYNQTPPRQPPEANRKRHDRKIWSSPLYNRALALTNKTWGNVSEYLELQHAVGANWPDIDSVVTALAINQAVDYSFGVRASFLKQRVYHSGYWPFPVGYDALSRLWR